MFRNGAEPALLPRIGMVAARLFIGLAYEERDLERDFGEAYREHRRRVPSLLPRLLK